MKSILKLKKAQGWESMLPLLLGILVAVLVLMWIWLKYEPTGSSLLAKLGFRH